MIFRVHYMKPDWFRDGICQFHALDPGSSLVIGIENL